MYGKSFSSKYSGSMVGKGFAIFAIWDYVIANMKPDKEIGAQLELNPILLAATFGEKQELIEKAIRALCAPDPDSRTKTEQGRRLVKMGQFCYRVVNGKKYMEIRTQEELQSANRERQAIFRAKNKVKLPGEDSAMKALKNGEASAADYSMPVAGGKTIEQAMEDAKAERTMSAADYAKADVAAGITF